MNNFRALADAVRTRFAEMEEGQLFVVDSDRDAVWDVYLRSFPTGTDPIYRKKTEHDCSCCRHFVRSVGNVVAVQNGTLVSVWDHTGLPEPYQTVADAVSKYVKSLPIRDAFLTKFSSHGVTSNVGLVGDQAVRFDHFAVAISRRHVNLAADERRGELRTAHHVLARGLTELSPAAVATVHDLITDNAIYRGQEHRASVEEFQKLQSRFLATPDATARDTLAWSMVSSPAARFRNTVIGTLVQDLTDGVDVERAVRSFETKVAPSNYKRPTAIITKAMVQDAMKTIDELGLEPALERRHARRSDVSVNSVLFVDNSVRGKMKDGVEGLLMEEVKPEKFNPDGATEITVEKFTDEVLPLATSVRLHLDNSLLSNFVSVTAPVHEGVPRLFKWNNDFAWSYDGNVTDSIKDKVKRAGGQVENVAMRVSLAWFNTDDLDLHVTEPNGTHIYYANKRGSGNGYLDVDMNVSSPVRDPVENVRWLKTPKNGNYLVHVHNFTRRESVNVGFVVEVESAHGLETFRHEKAVAFKQNKLVCTITVEGGRVTAVRAAPTDIIAGSVSREKWGLNTLDLVSVNSVVLSPNHWDDNSVGNKHWFFILDGCKNPLPTRGIYNEFLNSNLEKHRKVFEVLGDKAKCPVADDQLSGVGFSSGRNDRVTVVVTGPKLNKTYTVTF